MKDYGLLLKQLEQQGSLRQLPDIIHRGMWVEKDGNKMLNLSSNDYLGLASRKDLRDEFLDDIKQAEVPLSSSSSRLLTGNFSIYSDLENSIACGFNRETSLLFNSGYHVNTGILPALADKKSLILADKLVHASIIDGIRLSGAPFRRYPHNDYEELEKLIATNQEYEQIFIVTESVFSMDGDVCDLHRLVDIKKRYSNIILYVDEAHAIGVRGQNGLGIAEEQNCIQDIDLLVGTFGKAMASMGAYVVCSRIIRQYLINTMRPLIFSTALPPFQIAWTKFIFDRLSSFSRERANLSHISRMLREALANQGGEISESNIIPFIIGANDKTINVSHELQKKGFYCLPVRPPTVPAGTSRLRFSLTADITEKDINDLIKNIKGVL